MSEHQETKFDGMKASVTDESHPHFGEVCVCMGADRTNAGWGMKFKSTFTNEEFYVFNGGSIRWLEKPKNHTK